MMFTEASAARDYLFAGKGVVTLRTTRTGAHFTKAAAAFKFCVEALNKDRIPETLVISHEGRCRCCGLLSTTRGSFASGIGPECMENLGGKVPGLARKVLVRTHDPIVAEARPRAERERAAQTEFWRSYNAAPVSGMAAILDRFAAVHC